MGDNREDAATHEIEESKGPMSLQTVTLRIGSVTVVIVEDELPATRHSSRVFNFDETGINMIPTHALEVEVVEEEEDEEEIAFLSALVRTPGREEDDEAKDEAGVSHTPAASTTRETEEEVVREIVEEE